MFCRSPLVAVILLVLATHIVLALGDATRIAASETVPSDSSQTTRKSTRRTTSVDNKRRLRQQIMGKDGPVVNDVHAEERGFLNNKLAYKMFGDGLDMQEKIIKSGGKGLKNVLRKRLYNKVSRAEHRQVPATRH
uniref:Secreted RxLR effector protein 1 n=1 Tax=Plasmopara viticola TaxID=143451 RepID=RLR1_PLAVT|nr:RecName: Full=Secreted RxLR effector protein 1; Flags: Precursor [Plasmopara viticola]ANC73366.1 secreted RxLR effector peptide protein 1 [Plasmopara viticola]